MSHAEHTTLDSLITCEDAECVELLTPSATCDLCGDDDTYELTDLGNLCLVCYEGAEMFDLL